MKKSSLKQNLADLFRCLYLTTNKKLGVWFHLKVVKTNKIVLYYRSRVEVKETRRAMGKGAMGEGRDFVVV